MIPLKLLANKKAKSNKKSYIGVGITFAVIAGFLALIFGGGGLALGVILGGAVIVAFMIGTFFVLKAVDDLPDIIDK